MKGKFEISGRTPGHTGSSPTVMDDAVDRFVSGAEPMRTMTVQLPERLIYAFKQMALDRKTTLKALLTEAMEAYLAASKQ
jgi:hypothetical protein